MWKVRYLGRMSIRVSRFVVWISPVGYAQIERTSTTPYWCVPHTPNHRTHKDHPDTVFSHPLALPFHWLTVLFHISIRLLRTDRSYRLEVGDSRLTASVQEVNTLDTSKPTNVDDPIVDIREHFDLHRNFVFTQ